MEWLSAWLVWLLRVFGLASGGTEVLADYEVDSLLFMLEEEKMARDVYLELYEKWGDKVFQNIARSEQRHMEAVMRLLDKYGIEYTLLGRGSFLNEDIQRLYNELVSRGSESLEEAYRVGYLIELTDINDLRERYPNVREDIKSVFCSLERGSWNHLRAFGSKLGEEVVVEESC